VGELQFDVIVDRLKSEYGAVGKLEPVAFNIAKWAEGGWEVS